MKTIRFTVIVLGMAALATSGFSDDLLNRGRGGSGGNGAGQSSGNDRNRSSGGDRVRNDSSGGQRGSGGGGVDRIRSGGGSSGNSGGIDRGRGNSGGSGTGRSSGGDDRIRSGGGSSGNQGGIDRGPIQSNPARSTIMPTPCGPWPASRTVDQGPGGRMGHVDACGPSACPARFRTTSCEWANGPHAGPIMRPTRKPM